VKRLAILLLFVAAATVSSVASVSVLTYHNDKARTGRNTNETALTLGNVNTNSFGLLFTYAVDGYVYAQPLILANVAIPGKGVHNVVYVATEHDSVYAFDADSSAGSNAAPLWHASFINPSAGITSVPRGNVQCNDLVPEIGITSTPVIDPVGGTIYVVAKTAELVGDVTNYVHRLHALDVATGAEKLGGPVVIQGNVPGTGYDADGFGNVSFGPFRHLNRLGLLLNSGVVYFGFASSCDNDPYHGWLFGFNAQTLATNGIFNATPNGQRGGLWASGCGPSCDANGNLYVSTGNGTFDPVNANYGDSLLKLSTGSSLVVTDYFTPFNQSTLDANDSDVGSGGIVLLPDEAGSVAHPHLAVCAGKEGRIYLIDRDNMGKFNSGSDSQIVQSLPGAVGSSFGTPAFFNNTFYYIGMNDTLKAFTITNASIVSTPASQGSTTFGFPGATPSISANGTNDGIVWAIQSDAYASSGPAVLHAYNAADVSRELYNSSQAGTRDRPGGAVKFTVPTVANGKVYVGTESTLAVLGSFVAPPTVSIVSPANGMLYPAVTNLTITIVASATANNGSVISNIEFFADNTKIGETTSNPGTNVLHDPTPGSHVLSARAIDSLGLTNVSADVTITVGTKKSLLGDWEVTISGADKGAQFLTLKDDFSASGIGIRLKTFGLDAVSGHWGFDAKGRVTGPFVEQTGSTMNWTGTLSATVKSLKSVSGILTTTSGTFRWKGLPATTFPDLSGTWTGLVTVVKTATPVSYVITNNASDSGVFDIATTAAPGTVVGQLLATSRNRVYGYVMVGGQQITLSGNFSAARHSMTLKGTSTNGAKVAIKIFQ
jgi:hypothetical protein